MVRFFRLVAALAILIGVTACGGGSASPQETAAAQRQGLTAVTSATPQTGVWWNPSASGSGYGIEVQGNQLSLTVYQYGATGQAIWYTGILAQQADGSYAGSISDFSGGQSLAGAYKAPTGSHAAGTAMLAFTTAAAGTLVIQPTGASTSTTIPIQRYSFSSPAFSPASTRFQSGVWWAPAQSGRGYFIESQGNQVSIGSYMYDDAGNPVWYTGMATLQSDGVTAVSNLIQFAGGQTLAGVYKAPFVLSQSIGSLTFVATSTTTANLKLPNGNTILLTRFAFGSAASGSSTTPTTPTAPTAPTTLSIEKYVGTWSTACLTNPGVNESGKYTVAVTKVSDQMLSWTLSATRVTGTTCAGALLPGLFPPQTVNATYIDSIGGVDRFDSASGKQTAKIAGLTLTLANTLTARDSAGFPTIDATALDFLRQ